MCPNHRNWVEEGVAEKLSIVAADLERLTVWVCVAVIRASPFGKWISQINLAIVKMAVGNTCTAGLVDVDAPSATACVEAVAVT